MKKPPFIHILKRAGIVVAVSLGMLFVTTHNSSALTEDTTTQAEDIESSSESGSSTDENINNSDSSIINSNTGSDYVDSSDSDNSFSDNIDSVDSNDSFSGDIDSVDSNDSLSGDIDSTDSVNSSSDNIVPEGSDDMDSDNDNSNNSSDEDFSNSEPDDINSNNTDISNSDMSNSDTDSTDMTDSDSSNTDSADQASDIPDSDTPSSGTPSTVNPSSEESTTVNPNLHIRDESSDAVYTQPFYSRSELFWDMKDKITYNVALPIDNIPSFITQEMIIGALKCQDESGYPASVTIAQIIQESGYGNYGPGGEEHQGLSYLAYQYCNLFGIKGSGTAGSVEMYTFEQALSGEYYKTTSDFRAYNTYTECIEDRTKILKGYYSDLTKNVTDANTFAMKVGSRWATSQTYGQNLITQMKQYDLYRLDRLTLTDFSEMIGKFADPCPGSYQTSDFGYRTFDNKFHKGIDLGTNGYELPTYAAEAGTVITAGWDSTAGNWIVIDHGNGLVTKYMHHSKIFVEEGQHVEKGQQIGLTGNTGRSSGIHLHFQVEENGVAVDPSAYLSQPNEE